LARITAARIEQARAALGRLGDALTPLMAFRNEATADLRDIVRATVTVIEALGRDENGSLENLYAGDAGVRLAEFLRGLVGSTMPFLFGVEEWPDVLEALIATETVKPSHGGDSRVAIWGALEARLMTVDTIVIGGLNEGIWPRKA